MHSRPLTDILISYFIYFGIYSVGISFEQYTWVLVLLCILQVLVVHRLGLFVHSAVHYEFNKKNHSLNDLWYHRLFAPMFGLDLDFHRKIHFEHHRFLGDPGNDPEDTYSRGLSVMSFLEAARKNHTEAPNKHYRIYALLFHGCLLALMVYKIGILKGSFFYLLPLTFLKPIIFYIRNCLEHTTLDGSQSVTRDFESGFWSFFLGAAGFRLHLQHHLSPGVPYWELTESGPLNSYRKIFIKLLFRKRSKA